MKFESKCKTFHSQNCIWRYHLLNGIHFVQGEIRYRTNVTDSRAGTCAHTYRADFKFASSQWETSLQRNDVSHWLGVNLESVLIYGFPNSLYRTQLLPCLPTISFINTLRPRRNEQHFADDIFKRIYFNENVWISIKISLKFVSKGPINNIPALVQIMAWRRPGNKPLSEPVMVSLLTHISVTRPQWVNTLKSRQNGRLKIFIFWWFKFHWNFPPRVQLTICQHWFR